MFLLGWKWFVVNEKKKVLLVLIFFIGIISLFIGGYLVSKKLNNLNNEIQNKEQAKDDKVEENKTNTNNANKNNTSSNNEPKGESISKDISSKYELKSLGNLQYYLYIPSNPINNMPLIMYLHIGTNKKSSV